MEDFNGSNIDYNVSINCTSVIDEEKETSPRDVLAYIIISVGLPLTLLAIYGLYSQVRNGHVAPIYIINLLISDLIQFCCMIVYMAKHENDIIVNIFSSIYFYGLMASVCFMVCVSLERYLIIAWPLWYRFRRNIKISVVVCVVVWILPLLFLIFVLYIDESGHSHIMFGVFLLLPFPLFIFFMFGTIKALSAAISVPTDEKRRIVAILVLMLLIYTLLFLPTIIWFLAEEARNHDTFTKVSVTFINLSPLADLFLYVFSRKGAVDKFLVHVCCCRINSDRDISRTTE